MINEAPMTPGQRRARAAQTKQRFSTARSGQTLQNLRLKQKGSQDAMARARRTSSTAARPVAIDTGPVQTPVVPLSAPRIISRKPKPIKKVIILINKLYKNNYIIIFTSRYMGRNKDNIKKATKQGYKQTFNQLKKWKVKFHELRFGKPSYDVFVDDKSIFFKKNWINKFNIK